MGFNVNNMVKPQTKELNKNALIFAKETSPTKRPYLEDEKLNFSKTDILYLLKNMNKIYKLPYTLLKTVKLIQKDRLFIKTKISLEDYIQLQILAEKMGVDDFGFFEIKAENIFKDCGVPHKYALVFSIGMDKKAFSTAPSIECQLEVAKVYYDTGDIANKMAEFLQSKGFGASPNHSMGGQLDYSMAVEWAGFGITGRHSMAITPKNGPCHRVSVVYTSIDNLDDFISNSNEDMQWVKSFCQKCGKCIRKCPTNAILQEPILIDGYNPTRINYESCADEFTNYGCGICIKECPFSSGNYEKIKEAYEKSNRQ